MASLQVVADGPRLARVERGVGRGERAGGVEPAEGRRARPGRRVDGAGEEHDVGRHAGRRVVRRRRPGQ